jgi:hypothetical protein
MSGPLLGIPILWAGISWTCILWAYLSCGGYPVLRTGRVSVVIRRLVHHSWYGPAGKAQLERDQLCRTRQVLDREGFLMSISISSLPTYFLYFL